MIRDINGQQIAAKPRTTALKNRAGISATRNECYGLNDSDMNKDSMQGSVVYDDTVEEESVRDRAQNYYNNRLMPIKSLPSKKIKKNKDFRTLQHSKSPKVNSRSPANINWKNTENTIKLKQKQPIEMNNNGMNFFKPNQQVNESTVRASVNKSIDGKKIQVKLRKGTERNAV